MPIKERRRLCPNCEVEYLRFIGKQAHDGGMTEFIYECPNPSCRARWAISHADNPQGKRTGVQSIRRLR